MTSTRHLIAAALLASTVAPAQAGEVYSGIGWPGVLVGYAHPLDSRVTLRADIAGLGQVNEARTEEGIRYTGRATFTRMGLFADWFPFGGSFRTSVGLSSNDQKIDLVAFGDGGTLTIGSTTYATTASDRLDVKIAWPSTTPYLGIGWGHQAGRGMRFAADLGVAIGKAKVGAVVSGPLAGQVTQADLDRELAELRNGVGKVRALPQATVAVGYSF